MQFSKVLLLAIASLTAAQRPANTSICDYYTTALLKDNNATNQMTVLTLIVNTALIGNYTPALNKNVTVTGILNPGTVNSTAVNLLPYFDGSLLSTNRQNSPKSVSFLDDGGAAPLMKNMPSNGNTTSNQYMLITHLYSFFGVLAGCTQVGQTGFPAYSGNTDMASVHKYMNLNPTEMAYFISQVGLSAKSFGVASEDVTALGTALNQHFGYRCGPIESIIPSSPAQNQSICQDMSCPVAPNATCANTMNSTSPTYVNGTNFTAPSTTSGSNASGTSGSSSTSSGAAVPLVEMGTYTGVMGLAALVAMALV